MRWCEISPCYGGLCLLIGLHSIRQTVRKADHLGGIKIRHVLTDHSLVQRFRNGEQGAATQLYFRYAARLQSWASSQTSTAFTARFDEEDVIQSVFRTLFRRVSVGLYDVPPGEELWQLLLVIALNKIRKLATYHRAQKRNVDNTQGFDAIEFGRCQNLSYDETSLQTLQIVLNDLLRHFPETQRTIVRLRVERYKTDDIAERVGRSSRTVERVLQGFRLKLSGLLDAGPNQLN